MAQASTTMAHKILTKMTEDDNNNNNVLISPLSLHVAFALTLEAAAEETAAQLRTLMGFSADTSFDKVHHDMAALASEVVVGATRQGGLSLATALWVHDKLPLDPGFVARAAALGGANAQTVDFAHSDAARAVINDWVEEKTHGKIAHLIPSGVLDGLTKVVITSAVHFKAKWVTKFRTADTRLAPFHLLRGAGGSVQVDMMNHSNMRIDHGAFEHHEMASLAYKDSPVTMLVLLPNDNSADALQRVRDAVGDLGSQVKELVRKEVRLAMPRFKVETNVELSALLKLMGVSEPFGQTANFSRLTTTEEAARGLYVSQVFHRTFIEVDEEGTEAAAATAVIVRERCRQVSAKTEFIVDRPFVFVLYHTQLQCPLFVGQVTSLPNKAKEQSH